MDIVRRLLVTVKRQMTPAMSLTKLCDADQPE